MTQSHDDRSHHDGSIDFYRVRSTALRRQAMRDDHTLRLASAGALVMAGAVGFALVIPAAITLTLGDRIAVASSNSSQTR
jgi:hypothetical protein